MSTAIPGEVWRPTSAKQVQHLGLVEETGNQGTLLDEHTGGHPKMSEETIRNVKDRLLASPKKSLHQLSRESGLSRSTCQHAAKKAKLHAYRISMVHELKEPDQVKRVAYCRWFQTLLKENPGILDYTWFSDEAWFYLSGYVNSQNSRIWASENPDAIHEEPPHSEKIGVWCGMSRQCIIGPIFFDGTITTAVYMEIFNTFVNQLDDEELSSGYFQQDGMTSHTSHASMAKIQSFFGNCVISKGLRPPRSPDLTPPDSFLWGYLKGRVYQNKPWTIDTLKANITEEIQAVTADVLARTFQNMAHWVQSCLEANGGHFQHMLWCRHISYTMR